MCITGLNLIIPCIHSVNHHRGIRVRHIAFRWCEFRVTTTSKQIASYMKYTAIVHICMGYPIPVQELYRGGFERAWLWG